MSSAQKPEAEVRQALRDWIVKTSGKIQPSELLDSTPLIEKRIISSLHIMELILLIERIKGTRFNLKQIKPGAFGSVDAIYSSFFAESETVAR